MRRLLLAVLLMSLSSTVWSQSFVWTQFDNVNYNSNPAYPDFALALDEANGKVYSTRLVNPVQIYSQDVFGEQMLECRDLNGNLLWDFPIGNKAVANRLAVDATGNVYIGGSFMDTLFIGSSDSLANTGSGFVLNAFLIKVDGFGGFQWSQNLTLTWNLMERVDALEADLDGNVWYAYTPFSVAQIVRLDGTGTVNGLHSIDNAVMIGSISVDQWGGLYVSGAASDGNFIMDTDTFIVIEQYNMFVARFDPTGKPVWAQFAHDITFQKPIVQEDGHGNAYVTGSRYDTTTWGTISFLEPYFISDYYAVKVDSNGTFLWGLQQPPLLMGPWGSFETGSNLQTSVDANGNLYFAGAQRGTVYFGSTLFGTTPSAADRRISIVKVDSVGVAQWVKIGGSPFTNYQHSMTTASNGDCYFTCLNSDSAAYDTIQIATTNNANFVVGKIGPSLTSIPELGMSDDQPFFNTMDGMLIVDEKWLHAKASVYDLRGALILEVAEINSTQTDLSDLPHGLYLVQLEKNGKSVAGKLLMPGRNDK